MAHENSISESDGKGGFVNLSTVINGKNVSRDEAIRLHRVGKNPPLGGRTFKTIPEAVKRAKQRSDEFRPVAPKSGLQNVK